MGWARYLLLGDLGQQLDIEDQRSYLEQISANQSLRSATLESQVAGLYRENNELKLFLSAVLHLLVDKGVTTGAELQRLVDCIEYDSSGAGERRSLAPPVERDWQNEPPRPSA